MCRVLKVARSGYYAWLREPMSARAVEDMQLLELIKTSHSASDRVYGSRRVFKDLREAGVRIGRKRVARIMRQHKIRAVSGYKAPRFVASVPSVVIPNRLNRE